MSRYLLSILTITALGILGASGCVAGGGDESGEDVAASQSAWVCNGDLDCHPDEYPGYEGGSEPSCNECAYIPVKRGYFQVCANGPGVPTTFHPCTP